MLGWLALALILPTPADSLPRSSPAIDKAIAVDLQAHPDKVVTSAPILIKRVGRVLHVGHVRFADTGDCQASECERYRLDRVWPGGLIGVSLGEYEASDYLIVGEAGDVTPIGARPVASPSGRYLFVGLRDDMNGASAKDIPNSVTLWQTLDMGRVRVVDRPILQFAYPAFVAWHGEDCVEFASVPRGADFHVIKHYWLLREPLDWTLHDNAPPACAHD